MRADEGWNEEDYKKLFEFSMIKPKNNEKQNTGMSLYGKDVKEEDLENATF
jgi:hypothetical protein